MIAHINRGGTPTGLVALDAVPNAVSAATTREVHAAVAEPLRVTASHYFAAEKTVASR
jgi:hypothetical protein